METMPAMDGGHILIVEDEFLIRATLAEMLEDAGHGVVAVDSGEEALTLLGVDHSIVLMMTDMSLAGGMNGLTLASAARGLRANLPVIFVTGRPDMAPPPDDSPTAVVAKPYTSSEVVGAVSKLLGSAQV
jgi:CheY-like chemotaxis protein